MCVHCATSAEVRKPEKSGDYSPTRRPIAEETYACTMTTIAAVRGTLPAYHYQQEAITDMFADWCVDTPAEKRLLRRFHSSAKVNGRHLVLPLEQYPRMTDFGAMNDAFIEHGVTLGAEAITNALAEAGLQPSDVDLVISTTVTGFAAPSLEARIAGLIGLRPDVKRMPMYGLGCVAGAAGIARLHDYLLGHPNDVAVLLSVELCSLTVQHSDASVANLVASGLFGDGAAAVVAVGAEREGDWSGPQVVDSRSHLYPDTQRTMGWDIGSTGMKIVLDAAVPTLVEKYLGDDVTGFLADHSYGVDDVTGWVCHPGGPKVIEAIQSVLDLDEHALELTWSSLANVGNLSSASVLHVLQDTMHKRSFPAGSPGVLMAMGPGFCSELVLLRW